MSAARLRGVVLTCRLLNTAAATFTAAVSATFSTASNSAATAFSAAFSSAADLHRCRCLPRCCLS
jgi:hypothetical protein